MIAVLATWLAGLLGRLQRPASSSAPALEEVMTHEAQSFAETLARVAESQLTVCPQGKCEIGGNNKGPQIREYQKATWLTPGAWPWCAAFVCWCVLQALNAVGGVPHWKRPRTAGAYDLENWADGKHPHRPNGGWITLSPKSIDPRRGDIVTFTWSHVGIVVDYDPVKKLVTTVEGNAGNANVSDSTAGDGVVRKTHTLSKVRRILRNLHV